MMKTRPRPTDIVPNVAMNGGIRATVTSSPFNSPASAPTPIATAVAAQIEKPRSRTTIAPNTPASAATDPTDRSMPFVMMTIVWAVAMMAITAVCAPMLKRLSAVRK